MNLTLVILGNDAFFIDVQMILVPFFDISIAWYRFELRPSIDKKFKIEKGVASANF